MRARNVLIAVVWGAITGPSALCAEPQVSRQTAVSSGKFAFLMFYRDDSHPTLAMAKTLKQWAVKHDDDATAIFVQVDDDANKSLVDRFVAHDVELPLLIARAPNGAITAAFPEKCHEDELGKALFTPVMTDVVLGMQQEKLVFLHIHNDRPATPPAVGELMADARYKRRSVVISVAATTPAEARLVSQLRAGLPPNSSATLFIFAPPCLLVGHFDDASTKAELEAALHLHGKCCEASCKQGQHVPVRNQNH